MSAVRLPPNRLLWSERFVVLGFRLSILGSAVAVLGFLFSLPFLASALLIALVWRLRKKRPWQTVVNSGQQGTARFASPADLVDHGFLGRDDGLILGKFPGDTELAASPPLELIAFTSMRDPANVRQMLERFVMRRFPRRSRPAGGNLVRLPPTDKKSHVAFYFPTGIGKSRGVIIPNLRAMDDGAVIFDTSGEIYEETAEYRRRRGHEIRLIDPFGICGRSDRCNVLDLADPTKNSWFDYCRNLAPALVPEKDGAQHEPFWQNSSVAATEFLLGGIVTGGSEEHRSLETITELLNVNRFRDLATALSQHPNDALRRQAAQMLSYEGRTLSSLLACLISEFSWLNGQAFSAVLKDSTFSLQSLFQRKVSLYVVLPGHRVAEARAFLRLLFAAILYAAFEAGPNRNRPPVWLFLDEIASLGKGLPQLMTLYCMGRKYGLKSVSLFQSCGQIADLVGNNPEKIATVRSNFAAEIFKPYDLASARELSGWIGNTTVSAISTSEQTGTNSGWSNTEAANPSFGRSGGSSLSKTVTCNETSIPLIRPEQILQLPTDRAILISAGTPPTIVDILQTEDLPACSDQSAVSRYHRSYIRRLWLHGFITTFILAPGLALIGLLGFELGMQDIEKAEAIRRAQVEPPAPRTHPSMRRGIHRRSPNRSREPYRQAARAQKPDEADTTPYQAIGSRAKQFEFWC